MKYIFFDKQKKYIDPIYKKSCEKYYFEMYEIVEYVVRFISDFVKKIISNYYF